jgi:hypothetical protein
MRVDELRTELHEIAARAPGGSTDARAVVFDRGRRLVRRRRIAQTCTVLVAAVGLGAGVALWQADRGPDRRTIVSTPPASVSSTSSAPAIVAPTTVPRVIVPPAIVGPVTTTTLPPSTRALIPANAGFSFSTTPVVAGDSLFVIETHTGDATNARVARIDLRARQIVATSGQTGAAALVVEGDQLWVGVGPGPGGPFGAPAITRLVSLDLGTLAPRGNVALPAPGTEGLASSPGSVWALSGSTALRVDAAAGRVAATVPLVLPPSNPYRTLAVSNDATDLYVGWATARQIEGVTEFDAITGHMLRQNGQVGGGPSNVGPDLTYAGPRLWATFPTGTLGSAVALHASDLSATGEVVGGPNSLAIAPDGSAVWVSRDVDLDCVDLNDTTLASHAVVGGVIAAAAPAPDAVYVIGGNGITVIPRGHACTK